MIDFEEIYSDALIDYEDARNVPFSLPTFLIDRNIAKLAFVDSRLRGEGEQGINVRKLLNDYFEIMLIK
jgi:hypothetical protein